MINLIEQKVIELFSMLEGKNGADLLMFCAVILILLGIANLIESKYRDWRKGGKR